MNDLQQIIDMVGEEHAAMLINTRCFDIARKRGPWSIRVCSWMPFYWAQEQALAWGAREWLKDRERR